MRNICFAFIQQHVQGHHHQQQNQHQQQNVSIIRNWYYVAIVRQGSLFPKKTFAKCVEVPVFKP